MPTHAVGLVSGNFFTASGLQSSQVSNVRLEGFGECLIPCTVTYDDTCPGCCLDVIRDAILTSL